MIDALAQESDAARRSAGSWGSPRDQVFAATSVRPAIRPQNPVGAFVTLAAYAS